MRGIETNTKPLRFADILNDRREMLEFVTEARALTRRRFERDLRFHFRNNRPDRIERRDDFFQAGVFARAKVRSGMHDKKRQFQLIGANELLRKRAQ